MSEKKLTNGISDYTNLPVRRKARKRSTDLHFDVNMLTAKVIPIVTQTIILRAASFINRFKTTAKARPVLV